MVERNPMSDGTTLLPTERHEVGAASLLVAHHARREVDVTTPGGDAVRAMRTPAIVTGPGETLLEIAHDHWGNAGQVVCLARGDSAPEFDRLVRGVRLGVAAAPSSGLELCEARLLAWEQEKKWGNVKQASPSELDDLAGGSATDLLAPLGIVDWGTRSDVFQDHGRRRNFVVATFSWGASVPPMSVYVLTRVLPVMRAVVGESEVR